MALRSKSFITMWHDVEASVIGDWHAWHTHEHMPERVGIPGFLGGRRYWNDALPRQRCFTLYEGETAEAFRSPAYLERLNAPTPWTTRLQPHFRNFLRIACDIVVSEGIGIGGTVAAWRLTLAQDATLDAAAMTAVLRAAPTVMATHVARARPDITSYRTAETALRPAGEEAGFDALVLAEAVRHDDLAAAEPGLTATLRAMPGITVVQADLYDLSFRLEKADLS